MKLLAIALLAMGSSAFASSNSYDLKMDLSLNGKHVSSPRVIVKEGELATITQANGSETCFIEIIATEGSFQKHKGTVMNFVIGTLKGTPGKNEEKTILAKPQLFTKGNQPARVAQKGKDGTELFSLSVTAKKISP